LTRWRSFSGLHPGHLPLRLEAVRATTSGSDHQSLLLCLTPDWPTVAARGCRYLHTARAWLVDRLPDLVKMDPKYWLPDYRERVFFLLLCRTMPPEPSPCDLVCHLSPNPGISDILQTPASTVDRHALKDLVGPSQPKRAILYEYALFHPADAADLLLRIEGNSTFALELFVAKPKVRIFVGALRGILQSLGAMPPRPEGWIDPYPGLNPILLVQRDQVIAEAAATVAKRKADLQMARHDRIHQALKESRRELPATAAPHLERRRQPGIMSLTVWKRSCSLSLDSISSGSISSVIDGVSLRRGADQLPLSCRSSLADSVVLEDEATRPAQKRSPSPLPSEIVVSITNIRLQQPSLPPAPQLRKKQLSLSPRPRPQETRSPSPQPGPSRPSVLMGGFCSHGNSPVRQAVSHSGSCPC
jgi:hypothetical protein